MGEVGQSRQQRAVDAAARRCAFLQAYPEQACPEQAPMMKAFVRRNHPAVERARHEAIVQRATAWERMHSFPSPGDSKGAVDRASMVDSSPSSTPAATAPDAGTSTTFDRSYAAYAAFLDSPPATTTAPFANGVASHVEGRVFSRLAGAWAEHNRPTISSRRFGIAHEPSGEGGAARVAFAALVVTPMLIGRTSLMCDCDVEAVMNDAAWWVTLHEEEFEREFEKKEALLAEGGRLIEGCECEKSDICREQVGVLACCASSVRGRWLRLLPICRLLI